MEYNLPMSISCEKDLSHYENYLKKDNITQYSAFDSYLNSIKGKLIKAETIICGRLECRIGILMEVGSDYIIIKPSKECVSTVIKLEDIKFITVIHDNDRKKAMLR